MVGNLERSEGNFEKAREVFKEAQILWLERGNTLTHLFDGACLFKLGCVAYDLGDKEAVMFVVDILTTIEANLSFRADIYAML